MRRTLVLLALLLCSCSLGTPGPTETPPPTIQAEEYAVYSAMIRQNPVGYDMGSLIVVREQTSADAQQLERMLEEDRRLPTSLVDSYRSRNAESYPLSPELDLEQDYVVMPREEYDDVFPRGQTWLWDRFFELYPEAGGLILFSRVGFGAEGDEALVSMGFVCGDLCAAGGLYLLVREEDSWRVREELMAWMS